MGTLITLFVTKNYVNPVTGFHTQAIERSWADGKSHIKRARETGPVLQSHLDKLVWRKAHDGVRDLETFFEIFWNDVRKIFVAARRAAGPQVEAEHVAQLRPPVSGRQATAEVSR